MLRNVPRVRYGRLPGDNGVALRGLGPPFSHLNTESSVTRCKSASIAANCSLCFWYDVSNCNSMLESPRPGMSYASSSNSSSDTDSRPAALYQGGCLPLFNCLLVVSQCQPRVWYKNLFKPCSGGLLGYNSSATYKI
jgi:hypothetical protein